MGDGIFFNEDNMIIDAIYDTSSGCADIKNIGCMNEKTSIIPLYTSINSLNHNEAINTGKICYSKEEENKKHFVQRHHPSKKEPVAECEYCEKKFVNKGNYTFHLKTKHSVVSAPISCRFCEMTFKNTSEHLKHESTHFKPEERRKFSCTQCNKKFFSESDLNVHIKFVHVRQKSFICEECGKGYVNAASLNSHKVVHIEKRPFKCLKCSKSFKRLITLKIHMESHDNNKFICPTCGKQINSRALLSRHMVFHSEEKKYKCNFCEKKFRRPDAFKHHLILHSRLKPYGCVFCDLTFADGSNCRKHQKNAHPKELAAAEAKGLIRVCKNVPKIEQLRAINDNLLLKPHIKVSIMKDRSFACDICGKETSSSRSLEVHKLVHVEPTHKCNLCSRLFKNIEKLKVHMKNCNVQCLICNLKLKNNQSLKEHILLHTDIKSFKCLVCEYATKHRRNLKAHMLTHTGLKPYHCTFCEITYSDQSNCKKHIKNAHPAQFVEMEAKGLKIYSKNVPKFHELKQMMEQIKKKICGRKNTKYEDTQVFDSKLEKLPITFDENNIIIETNSGYENIENLSETNNEDSKMDSIIFEDSIKNLNEDDGKSCKIISLIVEENVTDNTFCDKGKKLKLKLINDNKTSEEVCQLNVNKESVNRTDTVNFEYTETTHECKPCNKKFLSKGTCACHLKTKHSSISESTACKFCGKLFKDISAHQKHEIIHLPLEKRNTFQCLQCDKKFLWEKHLKIHIKIVHVGKKSFICEKCGKGYLTLNALNTHKVVHSDENPFKCSKCSKTFKRFPALKEHLRNTHPQTKIFKCQLCEYACRYRRNLKTHMLIHAGLKPYHCSFCEISYSDFSNCKKHEKHVHPVEFAEMQSKRIMRAQNKTVPKFQKLKHMMQQKKKNMCPRKISKYEDAQDCDSKLKKLPITFDENNIIIEENNVYENINNYSETNNEDSKSDSIIVGDHINEGKIISEHCGKSSKIISMIVKEEILDNTFYDNGKKLRESDNKSSEEFFQVNVNKEKVNSSDTENVDCTETAAECKRCNKKFLSKGACASHLKTKHSLVSEPTACKFCGKLFKAISAHQKHELIHLPIETRKTFPCLQCDKKFLWEKHLKIHIKIVHVGKKSFICEKCGKGYLTLNALNTHKVVHSDEKPFKCSKCSKTFKRFPALKEHLRNTHTQTKNFKCQLCEYACRDRRNLKTHILIHAGLKPYHCSFCEVSYSDPSNCKKHEKHAHAVEFAEMQDKNIMRTNNKKVPTFQQLKHIMEQLIP